MTLCTACENLDCQSLLNSSEYSSLQIALQPGLGSACFFITQQYFDSYFSKQLSGLLIYMYVLNAEARLVPREN